jgi:hypothetical protein
LPTIAPPPTICRKPVVTTSSRPTIASRKPDALGPTADHQLVLAEPVTPIAAGRAALLFVRWAGEHGLATREWAVDEVWFLASEDFAPAHGYRLPPRRVFLGALQKIAGDSVTYDRRVDTRDGRLKGKTTFYRLAVKEGSEAGNAPDGRALAA